MSTGNLLPSCISICMALNADSIQYLWMLLKSKIKPESRALKLCSHLRPPSLKMPEVPLQMYLAPPVFGMELSTGNTKSGAVHRLTNRSCVPLLCSTARPPATYSRTHVSFLQLPKQPKSSGSPQRSRWDAKLATEALIEPMFD